ncbi:hypothetical protein C0J52_27350, partial [Blattella germanica]
YLTAGARQISQSERAGLTSDFLCKYGSCWSWRRPASVPYPQVWLTCTGKKALPNEKIPKFRIQDATEDMHEELVGYMRNIFAREENLCGTMKLADDPVSMNDFEVKGEAAGPVMRFVYEFALKYVNIFEIYGVDEYMSAFGLFVHPDFRDQGLAVHLLKPDFPWQKLLGSRPQ